MSKEREEVNKIIQKYLNGTATPEEIAFLEEYYNYFESYPDVLDNYSESEIDHLEKEIAVNICDLNLETDDSKERVIDRFSVTWLLRVAVVLLMGIVSYAFWINEKPEKIQVTQQVVVPQDFIPGGNKAILTTSDGAEIELDSIADGTIVYQDGVQISKNENGEIIYVFDAKAEDLPANEQIKYNTIETPAAGQYHLVLSDGSKVWLNAKSSIRFPVVFGLNERRVHVSGECYFEIAKQTARPFVVEINNRQEIEVVGTHFNVTAYPNDHEIKTTLLEGKVNVFDLNQNSRTEKKSLLPGDQLVKNTHTDKSVVRKVDLNEVIAWKNGLFYFNNTNLKTVMSQVERWYNVEVAYEGNAQLPSFSGKIHRNVNASELFEILRFAGVEFKIAGSTDPTKKGKIVILH